MHTKTQKQEIAKIRNWGQNTKPLKHENIETRYD